MSTPYSELRCIVQCQQAGGLSVSGRDLPLATATHLRLLRDNTDPSAATDHLLLDHCRERDDTGAFLCLRCRVSHPLEAKVLALHRQFGQAYALDLIDLATFGLDDDGRPLPYSAAASYSSPSFVPFTAEVVRTFRPGFCGLPQWARIKLQANNELKKHLRGHGLLLISDWALLADTSPSRIREAMECFAAGVVTPAHGLNLHANYLCHYREAKAAYRERTGKASGWQPDDTFLFLIAPDQLPRQTFEQLQTIAKAVRLIKTGQWQRITQASEDLEDSIPDPSNLGSIEDGVATAAELRTVIDTALDRAMNACFSSILKAEVQRDALLACLWRGFGEGLTNRPLAERCGITAGTVSKKLRLQQHTAAIATAAAIELKRNPAFEEVGHSVEGAERIVEALRNHLVEPEREGEVPLMRRWVQSMMNES